MIKFLMLFAFIYFDVFAQQNGDGAVSTSSAVSVPAANTPAPPVKIEDVKICVKRERDANGGSCPSQVGNSAGGSATPIDPTLCKPFIDQVQQCAEEVDLAEHDSCNYKNQKDMSTSYKILDGMAKTLGVTTGMNIQAACSKMKDMSQLANGALFAYKAACNVAQDQCLSDCESAVHMRRENSGFRSCGGGAYSARLDQDMRSCKKFSANINDATSHLMTLYATELNSKKCDEMTSANLQSYCQQKPDDPMCPNAQAADCSNATAAANNTVCICRTNPRDPRCGGSGSSSTTGNSNGSGSGSGSADGSALSAADARALQNASVGLDGSLGDDGFGGDPAGHGSGSGNAANGARGTGRNISGGGDGPAAGPGKQGAGGGAGQGTNTKINNGYYGGGGGGGFGGGSGGSGSSASGSGGYQPNGTGGTLGQAQVDLRQFLPGAKLDPSRGIAGISGPDGITGPNSDLWLKVNTRYRTIGPAMKP